MRANKKRNTIRKIISGAEAAMRIFRPESIAPNASPRRPLADHLGRAVSLSLIVGCIPAGPARQTEARSDARYASVESPECNASPGTHHTLPRQEISMTGANAAPQRAVDGRLRRVPTDSGCGIFFAARKARTLRNLHSIRLTPRRLDLQARDSC